MKLIFKFANCNRVNLKLRPTFCIYICKGQIMSECIYEIINFPKYHRKNLIDLCPGRFYRPDTYNLFWLFPRRLYLGECIAYLVWITYQGRNLSNFFGGILENWWFHKYILTSSDLYHRPYDQSMNCVYSRLKMQQPKRMKF